jgi:hypothetical protein
MRNFRAQAISVLLAIFCFAAQSVGANAKQFIWTKPSQWKEKEASGMRLGSFEVPGKSATEKGDLSIIMLAGDAGGVAANVNRWRGQAGLAELPEAEITKSAKEYKGPLGPIQIFQIQGEKDKDSILAGVIRHAGNTIFVKLTSKKDLILAKQSEFADFCKSIRSASAQNHKKN